MTAPPDGTEAPGAALLDWRRHRIGPLARCRICGTPALMRDATGRPCHKVCAEQASDTRAHADPGVLPGTARAA